MAGVEELVLEHLPLAKAIALKVGRRHPQVDADDLISWGMEGLFDAARKFELDRGIPFKGYARTRIEGHVRDGIRTVCGRFRNGEFQPKPQPLSWDDAECSVVDESPAADSLIARSEALRIVAAASRKLPPRERALVVRHYLRGERFDLVARDLGISKSWASRLHTQALGRLRRMVGESQLSAIGFAVRARGYWLLRDDGLCCRCGVQLETSAVHCPPCAREVAADKRYRYRVSLSKGTCHKCSEPAEDGTTRCRKHARHHLNYQRERRARSIAQGLCVTCGKRPRDGETRRCARCKYKRQESKKAARLAARGREVVLAA